MKINKIASTISITAAALFLAGSAIAQSNISDVIKAYRSYKEVGNFSIKVPTVVEVPFADEYLERYDFAVLNKTTNAFEPHYFKQQVTSNQVTISKIASNIQNGTESRMIDGDPKTYADFPLQEGLSEADIAIIYSKPITSSGFTFLVDNNVALPNFVEVRVFTDGVNKIVVAKKTVDGLNIKFPQTTSDKWYINFWYGQPLRISELKLQQDNATVTQARALRFLAQPDHNYRIYFDPDRYSPAPVGEAGDLSSSDKDILIAQAGLTQTNPNYSMADVDGDGVPDIKDNCVNVANPDQADIDKNGRGDACDDWDKDGIINSKDNCPNEPNSAQIDTDGDHIGDACDTEESRVTEKHKWIPWASLGLAALVVIVLLFFTIRSKPHKPEDPGPQPPSTPI